MAAAVPRRPDLRALVVSPPSDAASARYLTGLHELARSLGCEKHVSFVEDVQDVAPLFGGVDIVVMPSLREPFGRVIVEAMLACRPVIASNVDALPLIASDGTTGLLVPPADPNRLADALVHLASQPDLRRRMGIAGRQRALDRYAIAETASGVLEVYRRLLGNSRRPP